jgi:hypothetical protein
MSRDPVVVPDHADGGGGGSTRGIAERTRMVLPEGHGLVWTARMASCEERESSIASRIFIG